MRPVAVVRHAGGWTPQQCALARRAAHAALKTKNSSKEVCLVLADARCLRTLNRVYRGKDFFTDVLAFEGEGESLGDVVIAYEHARHPKKLCALVVHGVLHLLGFDHTHLHAAERMQVCEKTVLARIL